MLSAAVGLMWLTAMLQPGRLSVVESAPLLTVNVALHCDGRWQ